MGFYDIANHPLIYGMVVFGLIVIALMTVIALRRAQRRAIELGISKEDISKIKKRSVSFSVIPSIAIVVGFFSLAVMLGIPWPWWRLSVVGSLTYETTAAKMALNAAGVQLESATGDQFILIMWVMTIGIIAGIVIAPFISERIQSGTMKLKSQDKRWGALSSSIFMLAIIIAFGVPMFFGNIVQTLTLITSGVICIILTKIAQVFKLAWLRDFILVFTMVLSMACSVLWTALVG